MFGKNKNIDQIVQKAGFTGFKIRPTGSGHYNDSYFIDTDNERFVLRIAPADDVPKLFYEVDMMKSEPAIHQRVLERTDIPIPEIIYSDFSRDTIDRDYLIMKYMQGHSGSFDDEELGCYVKQLHRIQGDEYGYPDRTAPMGTTWPDIFFTYAELIFKDCLSSSAIDQNEYDHFLSVYDKYRSIFPEVPPCLLHLDLWTQNILTIDGRISALLDFDRGLYGDPELEFAVLDTYGYSTPAFFKGYGKPRPDDRDAQTRQKLYIVYEMIKYAFIRLARGKNMAVARNHVRQCMEIIGSIDNE